MTVVVTAPHPVAADGAARAAVRTISATDLRQAVLAGEEIAVVDVREGDRYATGHISVAVELPLSEIELRIAALLPRKDVPIVVTDDDGETLARAAAERLQALGYGQAVVLAGGLAHWAQEGNELVTGLNALSKALGEFVERHYHTPKISAEELRAKLDADENLVVLDTRPLEEFHHISIPGGVAAPGAELLYRAFDAVPSPTTPVVINCAGRTRAIIGAQALRNAGFPNPVVSLENGTSAWLLAGFEPGRGATEEAVAPTPEGLAKAKAAAERIIERFGLLAISRAELDAFRAEEDKHTLYVFDIRTPGEFAAGHVPGARSVPGGQLVQATDRFIGVRQGRVVLVDDADRVRAAITASWLVQLGLDHVFIYPASPEERTEQGSPAEPVLGDGETAQTLSPRDLEARIAAGEATVLDLEPAPPYYRERRYIPGAIVARRSSLARYIDKVPGRGAVVLTSSDGLLAKLAAAELAGHTPRPILALDGGTAAWAAAGLPTGEGLDQPSLDPAEALPRLPTLDERRTNLAAYVRWGDVITDQLARDGLVQFRAFGN